MILRKTCETILCLVKNHIPTKNIVQWVILAGLKIHDFEKKKCENICFCNFSFIYSLHYVIIFGQFWMTNIICAKYMPYFSDFWKKYTIYAKVDQLLITDAIKLGQFWMTNTIYSKIWPILNGRHNTCQSF